MPLYPILRPADWQHRSTTFGHYMVASPYDADDDEIVDTSEDEPADADLWVSYARVGAQANHVITNGSNGRYRRMTALDNLRKRAIELQVVDAYADGRPRIIKAVDEFAAELILVRDRMLELHRALNTQTLGVALCGRGVIAIADASDPEALAMIRAICERGYELSDSPLLPVPLLVVDGYPAGAAIDVMAEIHAVQQFVSHQASYASAN